MEELFNSREISIGIWLLALLLWALIKRTSDKSVLCCCGSA
jgi:hypothetical protein